MEYLFTKEFERQLARLHQQGGIPKKMAQKFQQAAFKMDPGTDPVKESLRKSNHGESRMQNCQKFALSDDYRLVTQVHYKKRIFIFIGKHDSTEEYLNNPRKTKLVVNKENEVSTVKTTTNLNDSDNKNKVRNNNFFESDFNDTKLLARLENKDHYDYVLSDIKPSVLSIILEMNTITNDDEITSCIDQIENEKKKEFIFDILIELRSGNLNEVKRRIQYQMGELIEYSSDDFINVKSGEDVVVLEVGSKDYEIWMTNFSKNSDHLEWLLFTHSKQQEIIDEDFDGPALLNGVAGSGKTCIIVHRAIRHARKKPKNKILILTLNRSLASLILKLISEACPQNLKEYIVVKSFFELCQDYIDIFDPKNVNKYYSDVAWKPVGILEDSEEHIDDIWKEYYRCEVNNEDAKVLLNIHKHFNERSVSAENYLRDEIDWIRSRFPKDKRNNYLTQDRKGRYYPISAEWRKEILKGLEGWELKMKDIGVIDYIGLSEKLMDFYENLEPSYSHILIDEVQDFGQLELQIIRKLVKKDKNDIFMVGDENQKASVKFRSFNSAGIALHNSRKRTITVNYRNSREILKAAYSVFERNLIPELADKDEDFEVLKPEFANFSSPKPKLVAGNNLEDEVSYSINYLRELMRDQENKNACLSLVGYTLTELKDFCREYKDEFTLLDGSIKDIKFFNENKIFISDLEQMKGYEFDFVVILNCKEDVIPNKYFTEEENYTLLRLLYISMTRAKDLLILSYSNKHSKYFDLDINCFDYTSWENLSEDIESDLKDFRSPIQRDQLRYPAGNDELIGLEFLYTEDAKGMTVDLQNRIEKYITGENLEREGNLIQWASINMAKEDLKKGNMTGRQLFGQQDVGWKEFREKFHLFD